MSHRQTDYTKKLAYVAFAQRLGYIVWSSFSNHIATHINRFRAFGVISEGNASFLMIHASS